MSGYETGLLWGFIIGAPLVGVMFRLGKTIIDDHFKEKARQLGLPERPDEEQT